MPSVNSSQFMSPLGLSLPELESLTVLIVYTRNTQYRIIVSNGADVIVQGGSLFPNPTPASFDGSIVGSSVLRRGWIGVGCPMKIRVEGRRIVTSTVQAIARAVPDTSARRPN